MELEMINCEDEFEEDIEFDDDFFEEDIDGRDEVIKELQRTIQDGYEAKRILLDMTGQ